MFSRYETGNGIFAEERGVMLNKGTENEANSVVGSYKYVSPEGVPIEVTYTAGVEGFKAYGAHLPVSPPAASNLPKNLALKNTISSAFARPPQFRTVDSELPAASHRPTPATVASSTSDDVSQFSRNDFAGQVAAAAEQSQPSFASVQDASEKPLPAQRQATEVYELSTAKQETQNSLVVKAPVETTYQQQFQSQQLLPAVSNQTPGPAQPSGDQSVFVASAPLPAAPAQTVPVPQTRQSFAPSTLQYPQRAVPGYQHQHQHQPHAFNTRLLTTPVFNHQLRGAGPVRQFSVEPQQMWYVPHNQQGRYFQTPIVQRTFEPPKY